MISGKIFSGVKVGEPFKVTNGFFICPLILEESESSVEYDLLEEAIQKGYVKVDEKKDGAEVSTIMVNVNEPKNVLVVEGEVLAGGLQTRTVNISLLLTQGENPIPVSCVERGRWGRYRNYEVRDFLIDSNLRTKKVASVKADRMYRSNQGAVWNHVSNMFFKMGTYSSTESYEDLFVKSGDEIKERLKDIKPIDGQVGSVVVINGEVVGVDMFDKPETWAKLSEKILGSYMLTWFVSNEKLDISGQIKDKVEAFLKSIDKVKRSVNKSPVGIGEHHFISEGNLEGFALVKDGKVIHLFVGVQKG